MAEFLSYSSGSILCEDDLFLGIAGGDVVCFEKTIASLEAGHFAEFLGNAGAHIARSRACKRCAAAGAFALEYYAANNSLGADSRLRQFNGVETTGVGMCLRGSEKENCAGCDSADERAEARRSLGEVNVFNPLSGPCLSKPAIPYRAWPEFEPLENQLRIAIYSTRF